MYTRGILHHLTQVVLEKRPLNGCSNSCTDLLTYHCHRPHRYAKHKMRTIATECCVVCMSVGHSYELCQNGWTDRDVVWVWNRQGTIYYGHGGGGFSRLTVSVGNIRRVVNILTLFTKRQQRCGASLQVLQQLVIIFTDHYSWQCDPFADRLSDRCAVVKVVMCSRGGLSLWGIGGQGQSPWSGGRSPPEAESILVIGCPTEPAPVCENSMFCYGPLVSVGGPRVCNNFYRSTNC